jgi:hypothetical protein
MTVSSECLGELERAHLPHPGHLERRHPRRGTTLEGPRPGVRLVETGEQIEQGRLAGAVGPDQRRDSAAGDLDMLNVDGLEAAEGAGHPVGDEDRVTFLAAGFRGADVQVGRLDRFVAGGGVT